MIVKLKNFGCSFFSLIAIKSGQGNVAVIKNTNKNINMHLLMYKEKAKLTSTRVGYTWSHIHFAMWGNTFYLKSGNENSISARSNTLRGVSRTNTFTAFGLKAF